MTKFKQLHSFYGCTINTVVYAYIIISLTSLLLLYN